MKLRDSVEFTNSTEVHNFWAGIGPRIDSDKEDANRKHDDFSRIFINHLFHSFFSFTLNQTAVFI